MVEHLSEDERFDASQYAFFGGDVSQEVELGGLDELDDNGLMNDDERLLGFSEKDEGEILDVGSQLDDIPADISELSSSYTNLQLNSHEVEHDENSQALGHYQNPINETHGVRESSYPSEMQWVEPEPGISPKSFSMARPFPPHPPQSIQFQSFNQRAHVSSPYSFHIGGPGPAYSQYGVSQIYNEPSFQPPWVSPSRASMPISPPLMQHQIPQQHLMLPPHVIPQRLAQVRPDYVPSPSYNTQPSAPALVIKPNDYLTTGDLRDDLTPRSRQTPWQFPYHNDANNRTTGRQPFRSKYMTAEEIESIARIQLAATHSNDPYIDDYYHQAVQAKLAVGNLHGRRQFAPSSLRDLPSRTRAPSVAPAFVPVDGLGKVPFSSVRCPRPLLEVDGLDAASGIVNANPSDRPLEQEPMLVARIAIEDGWCLLLDVDDIDRYLLANNFSDNGAHLRRRRQMLLEDLAVSMQLMDSVAGGKQGNTSSFTEVGHKDDSVLLHLLSLPKGRKFVSRYLQLLTSGSHLIHIVCKAVFRHLQWLFGGGVELCASPATIGLANAVASCIDKMSLSMLTSCLSAGVFSPDPPLFRPLGSVSGDGATIAIKAVLERATKVLVDRNFTFPLDERKLWQATFDEFFVLLYTYCMKKYDSIIHSLMMVMPGNMDAIRSKAAETIGKEMPVELLRASLPHMNEQQRESLLEFAQRSMSVGGQGGGGHTVTFASGRDAAFLYAGSVVIAWTPQLMVGVV